MSMIRKVLPGAVGKNKFAGKGGLRPLEQTRKMNPQPPAPSFAKPVAEKTVDYSALHAPMRVRMERAVPRRVDG